MDYLAIQALPLRWNVFGVVLLIPIWQRSGIDYPQIVYIVALQLLKMVYRQQRVRKLSAEERLMLINEEDWVDGFSSAQSLQFPELEIDLSY